MSKRSRPSEPPTSTVPVVGKPSTEKPFEPFIDRALADPVCALRTDMDRFDTDPKVLEDLSMIVNSGEQVQTLWFEELREEWKKAPPQTPMDAAKLVFKVMYKVHPGSVDVTDFEGFLFHYSLPCYRDVLPGAKAGPRLLQMLSCPSSDDDEDYEEEEKEEEDEDD